MSDIISNEPSKYVVTPREKARRKLVEQVQGLLEVIEHTFDDEYFEPEKAARVQAAIYTLKEVLTELFGARPEVGWVPLKVDLTDDDVEAAD